MKFKSFFFFLRLQKKKKISLGVGRIGLAGPRLVRGCDLIKRRKVIPRCEEWMEV